MSTDGGQHDSRTLWQKFLAKTVHREKPWTTVPLTAAPWRLLEALAFAGILIWLVTSSGRQERMPDPGQQAAARALTPQTPQTPAFSDPRALVPAGQAAQAPPPAAVAARPVTPAAVSPAPVVAKAPSAPVPAMPPPQAAASPNKPAQMAANIPPPPPSGQAGGAPPTRGNDACPPPEIRIAPAAGGQMQIQIVSPCRQGQDIGLSYDTVALRRMLPAGGSGTFTLDLFAGDRKSVDVTFADGTRRVLPAVAHDLGRVSKVAVRWHAPVNLDLHVFENGATAGQPGHVWTAAPASAVAAVDAVKATGRGQGFLNAFDEGPGDKVEIYTYVHGPQDQGTNVAMALDHETRGSQPTAATCGQGALAKVDFAVTLLSRSGQLARATGAFKAARCDQPLAAAERFDYGLMPVIALPAVAAKN